ncbi:MAG: hypothetical protein HN742_14320 [Lentisphaerae bacterium]|jgi:hypothetical protein|nr:hypothetical protein [Lentisphaerota bacterium]MBT4814462.1 hypothetical protein [Lentisphaerota bacterium]MBT5608718.1 hypothetical protein [Lentisphaerota bacterium]MBT7062162.1 hypothetical protein [Lentisphaerota bacterium]MBT7843050.1 hypothetical protein [Lentisphaerota bacterium]
MNTKRTGTMTMAILMALVGLIGLANNVRADERTGRQISELVSDLNRGLTEARKKVEKLETERREARDAHAGDVLPERKAALERLAETSKALDEEKDPEEKLALSEELDGRLLEVGTLSADYLEAMKDELLGEDEQMRIIDEALSDAILKMGKLQSLTAEAGGEQSPRQRREAKRRARRELQSVARMVEMLAPKTGSKKRWNSVRRTIAMQNALLKRATLDHAELRTILADQQAVYEQAQAQISLARQGITEERDILQQVALGEVARSLVRKAARLMLGTCRVEDIGATAFLSAERRQQSLFDFLEQEEGRDLDGSGAGGADSDEPNGYGDFLNEAI